MVEAPMIDIAEIPGARLMITNDMALAGLNAVGQIARSGEIRDRRQCLALPCPMRGGQIPQDGFRIRRIAVEPALLRIHNERCDRYG